MSRLWSLGLVLVVVLASGIAHGLWTGRWNVSNDLDRAAARLARVPMVFGDWDGRTGELDDRQMRAADLSGAQVCEYVNRRTGSVVSILLVCGRPGQVSVHTPEFCYGGNGYEMLGKRSRFSSSSLPSAEFWICDMRRPRATMLDRLRIYYSWSVKGGWSAPENPRLTFFREPVLYKLYVIRKLLQEGEPPDDDAAVDFLKVFLPQLEKSVFAMQ